ncbi:unnamed protein product [Mortierella alpina]
MVSKVWPADMDPCLLCAIVAAGYPDKEDRYHTHRHTHTRQQPFASPTSLDEEHPVAAFTGPVNVAMLGYPLTHSLTHSLTHTDTDTRTHTSCSFSPSSQLLPSSSTMPNLLTTLAQVSKTQ